MKEKLKKAAKIALQAVTGVILAMIAVVFILSKINGPVFLFGRTTMWVLTDSMSPTIHPRSYILVKKATVDDVKEGDVIAFFSTDPQISGQLNTHRVIKKEGDVLVTKGDGNPVDDGIYSAKAENVVGIYEKTLPVITYLGRLVLSEVGFMVVVFLLLLVTALCYLPDIRSAVQKKEKENEQSKQEEIDRLVQEEIKKLIELRPLDALKDENGNIKLPPADKKSDSEKE